MLAQHGPQQIVSLQWQSMLQLTHNYGNMSMMTLWMRWSAGRQPGNGTTNLAMGLISLRFSLAVLSEFAHSHSVWNTWQHRVVTFQNSPIAKSKTVLVIVETIRPRWNYLFIDRSVFILCFQFRLMSSARHCRFTKQENQKKIIACDANQTTENNPRKFLTTNCTRSSFRDNDVPTKLFPHAHEIALAARCAIFIIT